MNVQKKVSINYGSWQEKFGTLWQAQIQNLQEKFGKAIVQIQHPATHMTDIPIIIIERSHWVQVLTYVKSAENFNYDFLTDYTATDETPAPLRFQLVVQLFNVQNFSRMRFKTSVPENEEMPTLIELWPGANWAEREIYDMFGVKFKGHPDLRRILMDIRWEGHPLRKDYPVRGYQIFPTPEPIDTKLLEGD